MNNNSKFQKLLEPFHIGSVKTRNRMIKTGAATMLWSEDALHMSDNIKYFYEALAKGGIGLLIVESPIIDYPIGAAGGEGIRSDDDKYIKGMSELTEVIHKYNCPTFMQMNHDGPWQTNHWDPPGVTPLNSGKPIAASPVSVQAVTDFHNDVPRELTITEIEALIDKFASAAVRAQKAGFDGVDLNSGSTHLLHNFLSPYWNRRQDMYGGSVEKRTRFLASIIKEIKKRAGQDFPVSVTINGVEIGAFMNIPDNQCLTKEDTPKIARILQDAGADAIQVRSQWIGYHVAGFLPDTIFYPEPPVPLEPYAHTFDLSHWGIGGQVPLAVNIKQAVSIPVIAVGRLGPEIGEKILREGKADFIAMTRRLFADPELPNKVAAGRLEDIAPCTACYTCIDPARKTKQCRINAALGSAESYTITPAARKKRVIVAGGGPGGMEAARVAALRGHEVTLFEKTNKLGGLIPIASLVKELEIQNMPDIIRYLNTQITKLGVNIKTRTELTPSIVDELKPDVVILAVGGIPVVPPIPGINKRNVISNKDLHKMLKFYLKFLKPDALRRLTKIWMPIGKKVVIIGGGKAGYELAEFLIKRNRKVTLVDTQPVDSLDAESLLDTLMFAWFRKKGVLIYNSVKLVEVTDRGLSIITQEGKPLIIEADSIVPAIPMQPNTDLLKALKGRVPEIYSVGDCRDPRLVADAISDGWQVTHHL